MTRYSEFIKQGNEVCYHGMRVMIDEVLDIFFADYPTGEELGSHPHYYISNVVFENGETAKLPITKLVPIRHVADLSEEELIKLKREIHAGSCYYSDYENSFGIERHELSDVCDSYMEALYSESQYEWLTKDTPENFAEYCMDYYCYTEFFS